MTFSKINLKIKKKIIIITLFFIVFDLKKKIGIKSDCFISYNFMEKKLSKMINELLKGLKG